MLLRIIRQRSVLAYSYSAAQNKTDLLNELKKNFGKDRQQIQVVTPQEERQDYVKSQALEIFQSKALNFAPQIQGKTTVISCKTNFTNFTVPQILSGGFGALLTYQLFMGSMNYVTLGLTGIGSLAYGLIAFGHAFVKRSNIIRDIQIGNDNLIHVSFFRKGELHKFQQIAVQKSNFKYNALYPNKFIRFFAGRQNGIWCEINNQYFWIAIQGMRVNNTNFHKLL